MKLVRQIPETKPTSVRVAAPRLSRTLSVTRFPNKQFVNLFIYQKVNPLVFCFYLAVIGLLISSFIHAATFFGLSPTLNSPCFLLLFPLHIVSLALSAMVPHKSSRETTAILPTIPWLGYLLAIFALYIVCNYFYCTLNGGGGNRWTIKTVHRLPPPPLSCLLYTSPSPRDRQKSRMPSSA